MAIGAKFSCICRYKGCAALEGVYGFTGFGSAKSRDLLVLQRQVERQQVP